MLRTVFGPQWQKAIELHNEELQNLYASPNIIKVSKLERGLYARACNMHGKEEK
jgi:hypothetical protein